MGASKTAVLAAPHALFDSLRHINAQHIPAALPVGYVRSDLEHALAFLRAYQGSQGTFNAYRRDVERLLHWCALIVDKSLAALKREDITAFITFCQKPPPQWIGCKKLARFIEQHGVRVAHPQWRPFVVTVSKLDHRRGIQPDLEQFSLGQGSVKELFAILSSFYQYLLQEEYVTANPVALIRQKSRFIRRTQSRPKIRRLSSLQWQYVIETVAEQAVQDPNKHERTLFIFSALYALYLRISELTATERWTPRMNDFFRDQDELWWFNTVGKGNKERQIAVSDAMLCALKRWRGHLGLSPLPSPADHSPLLPRTRGVGPIKSSNHIRRIVQQGFDAAIQALHRDGLGEEADTLQEATVHWLRHTGISDDVKIRPREHVRDDAGHSSGAVTDQYINVELCERYRSAWKKPIAG